MKECNYCKESFPIEDFVYRGRLVHKCLKCRKSDKKEQDAARRVRKKEDIRESKKGYRKRLRSEVMEGYGNKCSCCGFDDPRALALDHVNNNGAEERRNSHRIQIWVKIIRDGFPKDYQVLCANCNAIKEFERNKE